MHKSIIYHCIFLLILTSQIANVGCARQTHRNTSGFTANQKTAEQEFVATHKLAQQGNTEAQFNLGHMYEYGHGVPKNEAEAMNWFRLAAEQGDAGVQKALENMK